MLSQSTKRRSGALRRTLFAGASLLVMSAPALAQDADLPSQAEMWRIIQEQAKQLEEQGRLIRQLTDGQKEVKAEQAETKQRVQKTEERVVETQQQVSETADAIDQVAQAPSTSTNGAPAKRGWWDRTSIGGYGELHYEGGDKDEVDFHRFVLFFGHEFTDDIRFFSEVELEHALAGEGKEGEVELEQAFLQFDLSDQTRLNAGVQLIPVGILNETHEPPTFYGVERNRVESNIIPTTWWEAAVGLQGNLGESGFSYDIVASSGLKTPVTGSNAFRIRNGRQKVSEASAKDPAVTARVKYTGIPGVEIAASGNYQFDVTQGAGDPMTGQDVSAFLFTSHIDAQKNGFGLRALYASWWLDGTTPELLGRDRQYGFYVEPSYRFPLETEDRDLGELGFFYRYSMFDNNAGISMSTTRAARHVIGLNYWPHPNIALKADYYWEDPEVGADDNRFNLGIGYQF